MTPDDVAAYRADAYREPSLEAHRIRALCDALTAAWAERDEWADRAGRAESKVHIQAGLRGRAERAEAELLSAQVLLEGSTTRAERAEEDFNRAVAERAEYLKRFRDAEAALARVRALCAGRPTHDYLEVARIRAAIEGDNQ